MKSVVLSRHFIETVSGDLDFASVLRSHIYIRVEEQIQSFSSLPSERYAMGEAQAAWHLLQNFGEKFGFACAHRRSHDDQAAIGQSCVKIALLQCERWLIGQVWESVI